MFTRHHSISIIGSFVLAFTVGCGDDEGELTVDAGVDASMPDASIDAGSEPTLDELYQAAVDDAEIAEADEIVDTLTIIDDANTDLIRDDQGRVLMVTWTSYDGYDAQVGQDTTLPAPVEVWVTAAPQMQDFCQALGLQQSELSLRLEQLLGLPPANGKDRVVQLWVPADAMFRPSPDAEITDSVADLDFPVGTTQEHMTWIDDLIASSYGEGGYPWTRLGYTYDWNPDAPDEVGLSEYVVAGGSTIGVDSVTSTDEYCQAQ